MEIDKDTMIVRSDGPVGTSIPGETVILDPAKGVYFGLDGVGARVWELLANPIRFGDLIDTLESEYEVDRATLESDIRALLADLTDAGLTGEDAG